MMMCDTRECLDLGSWICYLLDTKSNSGVNSVRILFTVHHSGSGENKEHKYLL